METRVPHQQVPQPNPPRDVSGSPMDEQVPGTRPARPSSRRPLPEGAGREPAPPSAKDIPKTPARRVYTVVGIIVALLFAVYLVWAFTQAGQDVVEGQPVPVEFTD